MKEKNIFIGILIVALLAIGTFAYRTAYRGMGRPLQVTSVTTPSAPVVTTSLAGKLSASQTVVLYTNKGFEPQAVTITKGSTVVFKNESTSGFWVASAPHPAHTDYPEFDAKKPVASGDSYAFTFERVGKWGYHDHLNPERYGFVTVVE